VRASPEHIAIAHASIDHCNLPHHGRPFGSLGRGSKVVSHLGEILSVHAIIFAEAGEKLKAANAAATTKFFIVVSRV
jgi:hypothetical protein